MKLCIIGSPRKTWTDMELLKEAKHHFDSVLFVPGTKLRIESLDGDGGGVGRSRLKIGYRNIDLLDEFDCVYLRFQRFGSITTTTFFSYLLMNTLTTGLYSPFKPQSLLLANNRMMLFDLLKRNNFSVPKVCLSGSVPSGIRSLESMEYPIRVRTGERFAIASSRREAIPMMETMEKLKQPIFIEERKPEPLIKCFVIGTDIYGFKTKPATREELLKGGGRLIHMKKTPRRIEGLALDVAELMGAAICRIDILPKTRTTLRVDVVPSLKEPSKACGFNLPERIIRYMRVDAERGGDKSLISRLILEIKHSLRDIF